MIAALPATKCRNDLAMGVSPWKTKQPRAVSPEGTTGPFGQPILVAPSGLHVRVDTSSTGSRPRLQHVVPSGLSPAAPPAWKTTASPSPKCGKMRKDEGKFIPCFGTGFVLVQKIPRASVKLACAREIDLSDHASLAPVDRSR